MNLHKLIKIGGLAAGFAATSLGIAKAQTVEEFYSKHNVTLVVSAAPGGASDFFAREFAKYFSKHIPGKPQMIIVNQAGASGMQAALQLQSSQPKDGSVIALLQRNNFYLPLVSEQNKQLDPRKLRWLGSLNKENYTVITWNTAPVSKADDLFKTPVKIGATSFANENRTFAAMMNDYFGAKFAIVTGYEGNEAVGLAMERGEVQGRMQTVNSLMAGSEAQWLKDKKINVLLQVSLEKDPNLPGVPSIMDYAKDPDTIALAKFMLGPLKAGRPFAVPPGVPEDRLAALRKAFDAAAADPEFLEAMKKINSAVDPINGAAVEEVIAELYKTPEPVLEKVRKLLTPK
ncbi:tripartite tricarboxylate transporter substrate-binding protein [Rhizobium sp. 1AS11]|uniref:Bug family tripartite tricarboxylate transporter substrate binding protein n=1 Tax=Rhizobium acaciae TaxID=2989736 RepID=UPI002223C42A|nr:tripartite tricarboxylate transporter substrate-binding protein [Rhizobium acaciae]MCW1411316.1 tripartite tricarboxylate transporter substrate-binding protein [Rhizobium acaciae]MCW1743272.1 tripartite tricarboxylate transporter substrate-binding protein [Rhizobium acaciae]